MRLRLQNPLSPLLDPGYVEATLRRHFEPLLDPAFDAILAPQYPRGVGLALNGARLGPDARRIMESAPIAVRLARKRKPSAAGYLVRDRVPLPEETHGLAISTFGKVIKRGWDWLGLTPVAPDRVGGLVEVPALAECLTLNKADFIRVGARGAVYLAYRKAIQEAVAAQLAAWGDLGDPGDRVRRRVARPVERDLESVLGRLADDFPLLASLVERRAGGQRRLPMGRPGDGLGGSDLLAPLTPVHGEAPLAEAAAGPGGESGAPAADRDAPRAPAPASTEDGAPPTPAPTATLPSERGRRQPGALRTQPPVRSASRRSGACPAGRVHRVDQRGPSGLPPRRGLAVRGLPHGGRRRARPRPARGRAREGARLPDGISLGLGRGDRSVEEAAVRIVGQAAEPGVMGHSHVGLFCTRVEPSGSSPGLDDGDAAGERLAVQLLAFHHHEVPDQDVHQGHRHLSERALATHVAQPEAARRHHGSIRFHSHLVTDRKSSPPELLDHEDPATEVHLHDVTGVPEEYLARDGRHRREHQKA